ncbi:MobF family relaxase [Colwellia psychrerythraea]|uniref:Conjugative relaxase domain protein n=1 Tax=Colwellia psychrerythraea TaxID=28229 RepID=A0A099KXZ5_COLPS|nr:MobF family relaxase [Colwellia psychrerythraea]KGJ95579.1 conjugative relaxase domain protein [Colwellia psychrerythraea]
MLTISPIRSIKYYSDLAKEDYYLDGGEPNGVWAGKASKLLDLTGDVETEYYINVMHGFTPNKQYQLCQNAGTNKRYGWDLTFSAPKSVSAVWARANNELKLKIQQAHFQGAKAAISFIEDNAAVSRRNKQGLIREKVTGLVSATFEHATSRAQDPQLHTHCLVANVAPREDGSWGTLESRDLYLWHKAAGTLYRAELSSQLLSLGFEIEKDGDAFKLPVVPDEISTHYSKRGEMIKAELAKRGNAKSCSKSGDVAALATRVRKENVNRSVLYQEWHEELDELGFTENVILKKLSQSKQETLSWLNEIEKPKIELTLDTLEEHVSKQKSVFRMQDIYKSAAEIAQVSGGGAEKSQEVAKEFIEQKFSISLGLDEKHNALFTTQAVIDNEKAMINGAKELRKQNKFMLDHHVINASIAIKSFPLSEEQKEAVFSACQNNAFDIIQGSAGAGKSALMDCVSNAYKESGFKVIGCSIAKSAANNLAEEANIDTFTIAKLLKDKSLTENSILIIDEAGQMGTKDLRKIIDLVNSKKSKLILIGEDKQLDAIEHGGALKYLSQPEILGTTRVETIKRQREPWAREIVANFRDGKADKALQVLDEKGLLNFSDNAEETKDLLIEKWNDFRINNPNKKSLLLAQRWQDVTQLNERVRNILKDEGKVDSKEVSLKCSVSGKTFINKFAIGERIRLTKNDYSKSLSNGDLGNIVNIQAKVDGSYDFKVKLDNGNKVAVNTDEYCNEDGHLYMTQAYAMTVYASQGLTIDGDVFVYYTSGMDRANTYVACSRQKDNCHLFVNKKEIDAVDQSEIIKQLVSFMSNDKKNNLAIEHVKRRSEKIEEYSMTL